jgi:hypothetical protein
MYLNFLFIFGNSQEKLFLGFNSIKAFLGCFSKAYLCERKRVKENKMKSQS